MLSTTATLQAGHGRDQEMESDEMRRSDGKAAPSRWTDGQSFSSLVSQSEDAVLNQHKRLQSARMLSTFSRFRERQSRGKASDFTLSLISSISA